LACGALPAWRATRRGIAAAVSRIGRGTSADSRSQRALVAGQIAIATLLLCSTALMLRSYYKLTHEDPGFDAAHSVTFHVGAAWEEDRAAVGRMQLALVSALARIPGVTAVGFANFLPASNATIRYQVDLEGAAPSLQGNGRDHLTVGERSITGGYLQALGARMVAGTTCPDLDVMRNTGPKALVNRQFVAEYAGGQNVVGHLLRWTQEGPGGSASEIVGVVDDIREDNLRAAAVPYVYVCITPGYWPDPEYAVRSRGNPRALLGAVRALVHDVAPTRALFGLMTLQDDLDETLGQTRLQTAVIAAFGVAAVGLAVIGLYGLVALAVTTRRREIGIRIALGAEPRRVVWEVVARVAWLLAGGAAVGLLLTLAAQRELRTLVFGVAALDPATLAVAVLVLGIAASIATILPALRAARIDPASAMRDGG
ncbi:MAG TPA: FtsX-like permease family protein, partial [Gemmatimonadaceae bacterium]|nr:FtsX-like permease family protein [Gemmatimonadaceae bacterium]